MLSSVRRNFGVALVGSTVAAVFGLARTALLARSLSIEAYGDLLVAITAFSLIGVFVDLRLGDVVLRYLPEFRRHENPQGQVGTVVLAVGVTAVVSVAIALLALVSARWVSETILDDPEQTSTIRIYAVGGALVPLEVCLASVLRVVDRFRTYLAIQVSASAVSLVGLLGLTLAGELTLGRAAVVLAAAVVFQTTLSLTVVVQWVGDLRNTTSVIDALRSLRTHRRRIGRTTVHANVAGYVNAGDDHGVVFLIGAASSSAEAALYGLARQLVTPLRLLQSSAQQALGPAIVDLHAARDWHGLHSLFRRSVFALGAAMAAAAAIGVIAARWVIDLIAGPGFEDAVTPLRVLLATFVLAAAAVPCYPLALAFDRMGRRNAVAGLRIPLVLAALFINPGATAVASALLLAQVIASLAHQLPLARELKRRTSEPVS